MKRIFYLLSIVSVAAIFSTTISTTSWAEDDGEKRHVSVKNDSGMDAGSDSQAEVSDDGETITMDAGGLKPCVAGCKAGQAGEQVTFVRQGNGDRYVNEATGAQVTVDMGGE